MSSASSVRLTVRDLIALPGLNLTLAAGGGHGLDNEISWVHVSELADPTPWLNGNEFLLTTGIAVSDLEANQRSYLRRLSTHRLAGLGFGIGVGFAEVPHAILDEANARGFPVVVIPYELPFIALTRAALTYLANEQLNVLSRALAVQERLTSALLTAGGLETLLAVAAEVLGCSIAVQNDRGRTVAQQHTGRRRDFADAVTYPIQTQSDPMYLVAARDDGHFDNFADLVLNHTRTAVALELARRAAVSNAELRLAGDLIEDIEQGRVAPGEAARRLRAFGLDPANEHVTLIARRNDSAVDDVRVAVSVELMARKMPFLVATTSHEALFLVNASEREIFEVAAKLVEADVRLRTSLGRSAKLGELRNSIVEARTALATATERLSTFRDLGPLELLLALPEPALDAFSSRVLGNAAGDGTLVESLRVLLEHGCSWNAASEALGVHRHTLRYRMDKLAAQSGRHPAQPEHRMELWLAVKTLEALGRQRGISSAPTA
jgi:purine catabolism regulator